MKDDQYKEIVRTLELLLRESLETKMKIAAIETSLKNLEPALFAEYELAIRRLLDDKSFETNAASIANLTQRLLG